MYLPHSDSIGGSTGEYQPVNDLGTLGECDWELLTQWGEWIAIESPDCELDMCNAYIAEEYCSPAIPTDEANDYVIGISDTLDMLIAIGETVDCENLGESECSGEDFEDLANDISF